MKSNAVPLPLFCNLADDDALAPLLERLSRYARSTVRNEAMAEDAVSETLLAALEAPPDFDSPTRTSAWLFGVLKHKLVEQQLLRQLATRVAAELTTGLAADTNASLDTVLQGVVRRLAATNPSVEVYVLDGAGGIASRYPQARALQHPAVDLQPIKAFLANTPVPVLGDDPVSSSGRKVFSAAVLTRAGADPGYVYAVLQGSAYDMAAAMAGRAGVVQVALWSIGLITPLGLLAGLVAFRHVTRPIVQLTSEVQALERAATSNHPAQERVTEAPGSAVRDEIAILRLAFESLASANAQQWQRLNQQDQQRREWVANISHDLRTPPASMQGYLETVLMHSAALSEAERAQYLRTALAQSQRLSRLAQELLELAHLELGTVKPTLERFSMVELVPRSTSLPTSA
jgi:signal transduction histidine kinase